MKAWRIALAALFFLTGCPGATPGGPQAPLVGHSEVSVGAPLRSTPAAPPEPARDVEASPPAPLPSECPCPESSACVRQHGHPGPVRRDEPPPRFTCVPWLDRCLKDRRCECMNQGIQRCWPSTELPGACECDNGMR